MKTYKSLLSAILLLASYLFAGIFFQACKPDDCEEQEEVCDTCSMVYKPNIYIYPEAETVVNVTLEFPQGGKVVTSIPEYESGWNVLVSSEGIIDNEFQFLFYESSQPDVWQMEKGWCIASENLKDFFEKNLSDYGFLGREIKDFTDYWIPRLQLADYYSIYPQTKTIIDQVILLNVTNEPDNLLRLFYVIKESTSDISDELVEPQQETFTRTGFVVTEWGVVLK